MSTAATEVMKSHREWFSEAQNLIQKKLDEVESRERAAAAKQAELDQREARIKAAIAEVGSR
jgi:hypothetical protein